MAIAYLSKEDMKFNYFIQLTQININSAFYSAQKWKKDSEDVRRASGRC